ncbi:DUF885 domain-containing protein [Amnibacterium kyonggiense]|uniref:DUF885 domain-containing protein n=1 Tax=Amnibacterium kyonggiense TaxID=595671 RepID=UPI00105E2CCB|nr:DUF885 domain-containing protein [Amnibacterium kyonggiense]
MTDERVPTEIDRIAEDWVDASVALHPELAVVLGRPGQEGRYGDYSPDGLAADDAAERSVLRRLAAATPADEVDRVTKADLTRELELSIESRDAGLPLRDVNTIESPVQAVRDVFDLEPTATAEDWAAIERRLRGVAPALDGYLERLRAGVREGVVPAVRQVGLAAAQAAEFAAADGFFAGLAARAGAHDAVPASLTAAIESAAIAAAAAYGGLGTALEQEIAPAATPEDAIGRELYALQSRRFLGAAIDLDETYEWGLAELARMAEEQEEVASRIVPGGSVEDAIAALDADPAQRLDGTAALQAWMQRLSDAAIESLGATHFAIEGPVRTLECRIAPTRSGVIYYTPPSDDFSRPGAMWWSVPAGVERFTTWRETSTVYHEGVPGHHLQIATAMTNRSLNTWRRTAGTSGYWEGWALYAERLMAELGHLDADPDRLGMLDGQRMRAARVVVDIGLHLGKRDPAGDVWTRGAALDLLRRHVHMDDAFLRFEVDRYCGWPGQAPSYKVGQRLWEELRAESAGRAGAAFDVRAWHRRVLLMGGMGMDTLRTAVLG